MIGAAGISTEAGITDMIDEEADIHRQAIEQASRVIVLADGSKLGQVNVAAITALQPRRSTSWSPIEGPILSTSSACAYLGSRPPWPPQPSPAAPRPHWNPKRSTHDDAVRRSIGTIKPVIAMSTSPACPAGRDTTGPPAERG